MSLCRGSQAWPARAVLVPIPGPEQPHSSPEDTRGLDQSLHALAQLGGLIWCPTCSILAPEISQSLRSTGIAPVAFFAQITYGPTALLGRPHDGFERTTRGGMTNKPLVSIVEDDRFFRESMGRLMRSLGYTFEAFPSAADFLASRRLSETACLIADVHMPAMTGIELHKHLIDAGQAIPTILVTAYPNDVDRARALNDGVVCYLRKPIDEQHLIRCLRAALTSGESPEESP
jgi:CheY-like chemotaxis protein